MRFALICIIQPLPASVFNSFRMHGGSLITSINRVKTMSVDLKFTIIMVSGGKRETRVGVDGRIISTGS